MEKCRVRNVTGNVGLDCSLLASFNADFVSAVLHLGAESRKRLLAVIARAHWFGNNRLSIGEESSKQNCRFYLRAGHLHFVIDGLQPPACDSQRWPAPLPCFQF